MSKRVMTAALLALAAHTLVAGVALADTPIAASAGETIAAAAPRVKSALRTSVGKPVAPIAIDYELSAQPALGVPFDVRITASAQGITDLTLNVRADDGMQAGEPQLVSSSTDGDSRTWLLTATIAGEGTYYLSVLVQGQRGEEQPARDLLIPIQIGTATRAKGAATIEPKTDASGERIIVMPAQSSP